MYAAANHKLQLCHIPYSNNWSHQLLATSLEKMSLPNMLSDVPFHSANLISLNLIATLRLSILAYCKQGRHQNINDLNVEINHNSLNCVALPHINDLNVEINHNSLNCVALPH